MLGAILTIGGFIAAFNDVDFAIWVTIYGIYLVTIGE